MMCLKYHLILHVFSYCKEGLNSPFTQHILICTGKKNPILSPLAAQMTLTLISLESQNGALRLFLMHHAVFI